MRLGRAVLQIPSKSSVPPGLPLHNRRPRLTHAESTLLQVLIPLDFISSRINTYKKPGGGCPSQDAKVSQLVTPTTRPHHAHGSARRVHPGPAAIPVSPYSFPPKWEPRLISEHSLAAPILLLSVGCQLSAVSAPASPFHATLASRPQAAEIKTTLSPAFATPTHSATHKSFVCRSYKKHRGWGGTANPGCLSQFSHGPRIAGHESRIMGHCPRPPGSQVPLRRNPQSARITVVTGPQHSGKHLRSSRCLIEESGHRARQCRKPCPGRKSIPERRKGIALARRPGSNVLRAF
jgi:hypothetical protein